MSIRVIVLFILLLNPAFALVDFKVGEHIYEGKILINKKKVVFVINHNTDASTEFELKGKIPKKIYTQHKSNARLKIKIKKAFMSHEGEAELVKVEKYLDPFSKVKIYH